MPHELFGKADRPPASRSRRRVLTSASVAAHAIVVAVIVVIQLFAAGPLPLPHRPLLFEEIRHIQIAEVPLSAPARRPSGPSHLTSTDAAPTVEPPSVAPDTGLQPTSSTRGSAGTVFGVEHGIGDVGPIGVFVEPVRPAVVAPPEPVRLHKGIQAPQKIDDVTPVYPAIARSARVQGVVILEAVIDARGSVSSVQVLRSIPLLDQAAIDAVRRWRYTPALLNGQPVPVIVTITVRFQLQ
jgi:periplasmic protein TonB